MVLTLASSLLLTGCGEGDVYSGAAAIVNGKRIPVTELQESVDDLAVYSGQPELITKQDILVQLIFEPFVMEAGRKAGMDVSLEDVRKDFADKKITNPSPGALKSIQVMVTLSRLSNETGDQREKVIGDLLGQIEAADIQVNPRFGELDRMRASIAFGPTNWIPQLAGQAEDS